VRCGLDWTGLDWIGFVKGGIRLVKAKTPCIVLRILMELGSGTFESVFLADFKLTDVQYSVVFEKSRTELNYLPNPSDSKVTKKSRFWHWVHKANKTSCPSSDLKSKISSSDTATLRLS